MLLKLLQVEQIKMINYILYGKDIIINKENNTKQVLVDIVMGDYTHVFTSLEIVFSKKFK